MSAFDDMISAGLEEASAMFGETAFTFEGRTFHGVLNEYAGEQEVEIGGILGSYNATLVCAKPQFRLVTKPLQKTLNGALITMEGIGYRVERVSVDSASVTLGLRIAR